MSGSKDTKRDERLIDLTLDTVGEGELEAQFQERLAQAAELLSDASRFKGAKAIGCTITCEIVLERNLETGFYSVSVPGVKLKEPKKRPVVTGAYLREGSFKLEKPTQQLSILRPADDAAQTTEE